jgi:hypothetical protein
MAYSGEERYSSTYSTQHYMEAINFMSQPLYPQKRMLVPSEYKAG